MNASQASMKVGQFDLEVNLMAKILFGMLALLAFVLVALRRLEGIWHVYFLRFVLLLSSIIPISLQVNLVMAKTLYSLFIMRDRKMKDTVRRQALLLGEDNKRPREGGRERGGQKEGKKKEKEVEDAWTRDCRLKTTQGKSEERGV